jgi:hypothetical protein
MNPSDDEFNSVDRRLSESFPLSIDELLEALANEQVHQEFDKQ